MCTTTCFVVGNPGCRESGRPDIQLISGHVDTHTHTPSPAWSGTLYVIFVLFKSFKGSNSFSRANGPAFPKVSFIAQVVQENVLKPLKFTKEVFSGSCKANPAIVIVHFKEQELNHHKHLFGHPESHICNP